MVHDGQPEVPRYRLPSDIQPAFLAIIRRYTKDIDATDPSGIVSLMLNVYYTIIQGEISSRRLNHYAGKDPHGKIPVAGPSRR